MPREKTFSATRTLSAQPNFIPAPLRSGIGEGQEFRDCKKTPLLRFGEGHEFHSCRKCRPLNGGFQPLRECCPAKRLFPQPALCLRQPNFIPAPLRSGIGQGQEFRDCKKTPLLRLGKGTSSTRAENTAPSLAASSRWGNVAPRKDFFRNLHFVCTTELHSRAASLWHGEGQEFRDCKKTPLLRFREGHEFHSCRKYRPPLRSGLGKGTSSTRAVNAAPASLRFREGHEFHSCRKCRPLNGGFQPLGGMLPREKTLSATRTLSAQPNFIPAPLRSGIGEGQEFRDCEKTPLRSGLGKGTSSTRAVNAAPSMAASSR